MQWLRSGWVEGWLCAAALLGCSAAEPPPSGPPNVLLVSLDTLRADRLGCYGYERDTSPFLDRLAEEGVLFEHASSTSSWTLPSHASLFSGTWPTDHEVRVVSKPIPRRFPTLAERLARRGYGTGAVLSFQFLEGLQRGFGELRVLKLPKGATGIAPKVEAEARTLLPKLGTPWLLFLHYYDVHSPYLPAPEHARLFVEPYEGIATGGTLQLRQTREGSIRLGPDDARHLGNLYDAEIHELDAALARSFAWLEEEGHLENTVVVITSDHGEEFFEHGAFLHGRTLHQELVRVPLILWGAGVPRGLRVEQPVSLVDVLPTLLALVGAEPPTEEGVEGIDLTRFWRDPDGVDPERPVFAEGNYWIGRAPDNYRRAVRRGPWTLHYDAASDRVALYDLRSDPTEQVDVASREPQRAEELRRRLARVLPDAAPELAPPVPDELVDELRELGYVEGPGEPAAP